MNGFLMKIPSFNKHNAPEGDAKFICKECKMAFQSKASLELHKKKSRHSTGLIYFGKNDK
jgi:hypothetical protein